MRYFAINRIFSKKFMKKIFTFLLILSFVSCNDGDVIVTSFDFDNASLEFCGGQGGYVFYKINSEAFESLSLVLTTNDILFEETGVEEFTIDGASNFSNYRTYNDEVGGNYFCNTIPPTTPTINSDYLGTSGVATLTTTATREDNDGLAPEDEEEGDSDLDGLEDYYDFDDDGDNVPTITELGADYINGITDLPQDTDKDGIADYLDPDDDGDTILTRYEDTDGDLDPTNDITDPNFGPDYLNPSIQTETVIDTYRVHNYDLNSDISLFISNLVLINDSEELRLESVNMGEIIDIINTVIVITPPFIN